MGDGRQGGQAMEADVVVVGGGLAGITCAVGLAQQGLEICLVERGRRLGGRARSWIDEVTGDPVHIGPHILLSEYPNMLKLLDMLGTGDRVVWQEDSLLTFAEGTRAVDTTLWPLGAPFHLLPSMLFDDRCTPGQRLSNLPVTLYAMWLQEEDLLRLDGVNAGRFLRRMGVSQAYIDDFWSFMCMAIMNVPIEACSAGALMRFYQRFVGVGAFRFGFPDGGLGDLFAPQARTMLEEDGHPVMLEAQAVEFLGEGDDVQGVRLADGRRIQARRVVAALPPQDLARLSRPGWDERWQTFGDLPVFEPCPYISTFIWFDRKLTDRKMWARVYRPDDLNCDFYDLSNIHRGWEERPSVIASNIIYAARVGEMSDEEVLEATLAEIREFLPAATREAVTHRVINRIPMAIHCPFPGTEGRRPPVKTPVRGLWIAGDWTATSLPSSMESACASGWRVAEGVGESLGLPRATLEQSPTPLGGMAGALNDLSRRSPTRQLRRWARDMGRRVTEELGLKS